MPQRRRRVFVVGYLGDWRDAAAVLFERESVPGNFAESEEAWKRSSEDAGIRVGSLCARTAQSLGVQDATAGHLIPTKTHTFGNISRGAGPKPSGKVTPTLKSDHGRGSSDQSPCVAFTIHGTDKTAKVASQTDIAGAIRTKPPGSVENSSTTVALSGHAVRRLTPRECERLQGFPDDYTAITKADGPRYKALGNSMAVPVMRWIGERIQQVDDIIKAEKKI